MRLSCCIKRHTSTTQVWRQPRAPEVMIAWPAAVYGALLIGLLVGLLACSPVLVHYDCMSPLCVNPGIPVSPQDLSVSGADHAHFGTGRATCDSYTLGSSGQRIRMWTLFIWVPADRPRYHLEITVSRYAGPGTVSSADLQQSGYEGPVVGARVYTALSAPVVGAITVGVNADGASGSMDIQLSDRALKGTWRCTVVQPGQPIRRPAPTG